MSSWAAAATYNPNNKEALWGSYFYTPDKDVLRAPMKLETLPKVHEQLTWEFVDMTRTPIPLDCRFRTGEPALASLRATILHYRGRGASFHRMAELPA